MSRVVVTGGTGFIGTAAVAALRARGHEVHLLARSPQPVAECVVHGCDLLADDPARLLAELRPSHLLHLAWYAEPGKFWHAPENLDWVAASLRLARGFAAAGGRRLTVAGSGTEYDWRFPRLDERRTPPGARHLYGRAKAALFDLLSAAAPGLGLSLAWGRVFFLYGPGEHAGRLVSDVIDGVRAGRRVATSDGAQARDFLHVEDVAGALAALLDSPVEGPVNIASGTATPLRALIERVAALAGDATLVDYGARARQPGEPQYLVADVARLRDEVGFRPRFDLGAGLADTVARRAAAG